MSKIILFLSLFMIWAVTFSQDVEGTEDSDFRDDLNEVLLEAVYEGEFEIVQSLIGMGANPNAFDYSNNSALIYAAQGGFDEIAEFLIDNGADVNHSGYYGHTPLIEAARFNYFHIGEILVLNDADINATDVYGNTALFFTAASGNFFFADMLIFYGADVNHNKRRQISALHIACWYSQPEIAGLLLDAGAYINHEDEYGNTPLLAAVIAESIEMVWYMIESGADILAMNNDAHDAFSIAAINRDYEMFEFLAAYEMIPVEYPDKNNNPASIAILRNDRELRNLARQNYFKPSGLYLSHIIFEPLTSFNSNEFMAGFQAGILESRLGMSYMLGYESRPFSRRVLVEQDENLFYQYYEKRRLWYLSVKKQHVLFRYNHVLFGFHYGIKGGYTYGSYRGSSQRPDSKFLAIPYGGLFTGNNWIRLNAGYDYMNYGQQDIPVHRFSIGVKFMIPLFDIDYRAVNYSVF